MITFIYELFKSVLKFVKKFGRQPYLSIAALSILSRLCSSTALDHQTHLIALFLRDQPFCKKRIVIISQPKLFNNSLLLLFMKDRLQDKNNIMMNRPQNSLIFRLHIRNLNKPNKSVQQLSPIFQVQKWNAKAIPFKKKPFKSQQLQPLQQIELHNVQSQKNVRLLFKEYHYKIQEVDHQSKPPPLRKSVRNHEVENFSDWWFWIILDGLLTASVCCHFIFR